MPKSVDLYLIHQELFTDSFGILYLSCEHKILKKKFTLKKIDNDVSKRTKQQIIKLTFIFEFLDNQIKSSRVLKCINILRCQKILLSKNSRYMVYDYHPQKNIKQTIQLLSFEQRQKILLKIIQLIKEIHQNHFAVGNLTLNHLYLKNDNNILISNLMIAVNLNGNVKIVNTMALGTQTHFYAPQILQHGLITKAADIYSLAIIIKQMGLSTQQDGNLGIHKMPRISKEMLENMLCTQNKKRPTIQQVQKEFWLDRSRNKSTCSSSGSLQDQLKILQSPMTRKILETSRQTVLQTSSNRKINLNQKRSPYQQELSKKLGSQQKLLSVKSIKSFNTQNTIESNSILLSPPSRLNILPCSLRSISRDEEFSLQSPKLKLKPAKNYKDQLLVYRNTVSFLFQMIIFVQAERISSQLSYLLALQASKNTQNLLNLMETILSEKQGNLEDLHQLIVTTRKQQAKIAKIIEFMQKSSLTKKYQQSNYVEELKRFGRQMLKAHANVATTTQISLLSHNLTSRKSSANLHISQKSIKNSRQTQKLTDNKLFKTMILLRRLEFDDYYQFFVNKIKSPQEIQFWKDQYFQFQSNFGDKYFFMQIKDLLKIKK